MGIGMQAPPQITPPAWALCTPPPRRSWAHLTPEPRNQGLRRLQRLEPQWPAARRDPPSLASPTHVAASCDRPARPWGAPRLNPCPRSPPSPTVLPGVQRAPEIAALNSPTSPGPAPQNPATQQGRETGCWELSGEIWGVPRWAAEWSAETNSTLKDPHHLSLPLMLTPGSQCLQDPRVT